MIVIKLIVFFAFVGICWGIWGWKLAAGLAFLGLVVIVVLIKDAIEKNNNATPKTPTKASPAVPVNQDDEPSITYAERKNLLSSQVVTLHKQLEYYEDLIKNETDPAKLMKYYTHQNRIYKELDSIHAKIDKLNE